MSKNNIKKIAILTSGGDCSGLNAVMNAVVRRATEKKIEVYGIHDGTQGLMYPNISYRKLTVKDFQNEFSCIKNAGTILGTTSSVKLDKKVYMKYADAFRKGVEKIGVDAIIVVGGDGSAITVNDFIRETNINVILIPKTIDNDTPYTDYSIGFDTARNISMSMIDMLQTTASSHHRIFAIEVMGRDSGHLALHSAIAGSANICLIPEIPFKYENIVKKIVETKKQGLKYCLMVISEGCCKKDEDTNRDSKKMKDYISFTHYLVDRLNKENIGFVIKPSILGHIQRSGNPTCLDRVMATRFGVYAVDILCKGKSKRMVVLKGEKVIDVDLDEAVKTGARFVDVNGDLVKTAKALGMYIGEN